MKVRILKKRTKKNKEEERGKQEGGRIWRKCGRKLEIEEGEGREEEKSKEAEKGNKTKK